MQSRKVKKKGSFLVAFSLRGSVDAAARAVRISRDAVYDWRRTDPVFAAEFAAVKAARADARYDLIDPFLDAFIPVIRRCVPADLWARVSASLALEIVRLKKALRGVTASSRSENPPSPRPVPVDVTAHRRGEARDAHDL